jgi:cytochrome d ubiquinol oxidase subunit II
MMDFLLPHLFATVMGFALLMYVILDGYDLGVGILLLLAKDQYKDQMIASIGPFWDANETWIVLGVGVLLIAFPQAHGIILTSLYLPATLMLVGLVLRGIAFDFRVKAASGQKHMWNYVFFVGSLLAACCQGWMLGSYISGMDNSTTNFIFSGLTAVGLPTLYIMLGSCWLLCRVEGPLNKRAWHWAKIGWLPLGFAMLIVSMATPLVSTEIASRWFTLPQLIGLLPVPLLSVGAYLWIGLVVYGIIQGRPLHLLLSLALICLLSALGLAYSIYPDILIGRMTIIEAAADTSSLQFTLWGVLITVPVILLYTIFVYRIFSGKVTPETTY